LEDEITAFSEILPGLGKRHAVISAVGFVLKLYFCAAAL
jgi:hypothetical protein